MDGICDCSTSPSIHALQLCSLLSDARDAMAKTLYGRLFGWIVNKINCLLAPEEDIPPDEVREIGKFSRTMQCVSILCNTFNKLTISLKEMKLEKLNLRYNLVCSFQGFWTYLGLSILR